MGLCASSPVAADTDGGRHRRQQQDAEGSLYEGGAGAGKRQQQRDRQLQQGSTARSDTAPAAGAAKPALVLGQYADVKQHYAFDRVLGKGQFGVTRLVVDLATREQCACKSISKRKLVSQEDIEDVRREIKVMHHLSGHPHVVTFKGAYEDQHYIHIVMELCTGGELFEQLSAKGFYRERDAAHIMRTLLQVVQHCHTMCVVHRDLKPENFLFADDRRHVLKAIDFGLSAFCTEGSVLHDLVGSPYYMAPEVLRRQYGKAADIWSCGVILYILLCGWPPFYGSNAQQIFRAVLHDSLDLASPPWNTVSPQAKDCVRRMLVRAPSKRPDAHTILRHEFLRGGAASSPEAPLQPEILNRMKRFADMNRFKKEALRVVATHLPPEEIEGIRQMFQDMDTDGSGAISFEELREGLRRKGALVADGELQRIMAHIDLDGSNTLDFQEFLTATVFLGKLQRRENLMAAFQHFDGDGSGFICEDELLVALSEEGVSLETVQRMLDECDRDNDRRIDYEEFARMMLADDQHGRHSKPSAGRSRGPSVGGSAPRGSRHHDDNGVLPGSPEGSTAFAWAEELHQQSYRHRASSTKLHVMQGVKSGAWGLRSQHALGIDTLAQ